MTDADKPEFFRVLAGLATIKPGKQLTPEACEMWWLSMRDWEIDAFKAAATHLMRAVEFMPSPFHFEQLRKAGNLTAGEAWAKVLAYVRGGWVTWDDGSMSERYGIHAPKPPQEPAITRAVEALGGYRAIAATKEDAVHFLERRFCEHYADISDAQDVRESVPQIASTDRQALKGPQPVTALLGRKVEDAPA